MFVKRLIENYPQVDAKLFIGGLKVGVNPKINNMQPAYLAAKHELILISDSGIRSKKLIRRKKLTKNKNRTIFSFYFSFYFF